MLKTRHQRLGLGIFAVFLLGLIVLGAEAGFNLSNLAALAVSPSALTVISVGLFALAVAWIAVIVGTHLLTRPQAVTNAQRAIGAVVVGGLSFAVAAPLALASRDANAQGTLVNAVFKDQNQSKSQTRPTLAGNAADVWKDKTRLNILLLGADSNAARNAQDWGIRTDSIMVASIDTHTGNVVLIQVPRNMGRTPFPAGSDLAKAYPQGFYDGKTGTDLEYMVNAIWKNVPLQHPELFKNTDYPGGDALKLGVGAALGINLDYFLLINLDGVYSMVQALGGVVLNVNMRIPIAGNAEGKAATGYIQPGPNQRLNGYQAMWYARERQVSTDFQRMARQTCLVNAVIQQFTPQAVLTKYESIAAAGKQMIITDIPQQTLPLLTDLALKVKSGHMTRLMFINGEHGFVSANPNFTLMRQQVQSAITASNSTTAKPTANATSTATATSGASAPATSHTTSTATATNSNGIEDVTDACAYHPQSG